MQSGTQEVTKHIWQAEHGVVNHGTVATSRADWQPRLPLCELRFGWITIDAAQTMRDARCLILSNRWSTKHSL